MESSDQAQLRQHLRELRFAARGIGRDLKIDFGHLDDKVERLGRLTKREARYALLDLEDDLAAAHKAIDAELRAIPGTVQRGVVSAGTAVQNSVVGAAQATRTAFVEAGQNAKEASKTTFARLAGVNRKPMREWRNP